MFLDIELPVISGIEVMRKLRDYSSPLKVIIITAYGYFEYAQQALRLGAKDILLKPISSVQFIDMIGRVLGSNLTGNKTFNEILEYIDDNLSLNLSLGGLAKMFHTSPNYLTKLFVKYTQKTYTAYINGQRIAKAIELLTQSDLSIKEISEKVGFNSLNYFYKKFSEIAGSTPKTFQRE